MFGIGGGNGGGGGGGGLFDIIGKVADPLGLFSGGGQGGQGGGVGDILKVALNPAGAIIGAIGGEVNKASNDHATKTAQEASAANAITDVLNSNDVKDYDKHFSEQSYWGDLGESATTEIPKDGAHPDGYSGMSAQRFKDLQALKAVAVYMSYLDGDALKGRTHQFDQRNLEACARGEGNPPQALMEAARYLLDRPELLTELANKSNANGMINAAGIIAWAQGQKTVSQQPVTAPSDGPKPEEAPKTGGADKGGRIGGRCSDELAAAAKKHLTQEMVDKLNEAMAEASDGAKQSSHGAESGSTKSPGSTQSSHQASSVSDPYGKTLDDVITRFDGKLAEMDKAMLDLGLKAADGDAQAGAKLASLTRQYQRIVELRQEMHTLLSNLRKSFHDMSMTAINNIR